MSPPSGHLGNGASSGPTAAEEIDLTSPANLRKLVLNYLVHHCYADTALAFANDGITNSLAGPSSSADPRASSSSTSQAQPASETAGGVVSGSSDSIIGSPQQPAASRNGASTSRQAHPLSAPPLSREDSSMEVEADSLLALANNANGGGASAGTGMDLDEGNAADGSASSSFPRTAAAASNEHHTNGHSGNGASNSSGRTPGSTAWLVEETQARAGTEDEDEGDMQSDLPPAELRAVKIRKEICDHIVNGRIRLAIDLCNAHFPAVLNSDVAAAATAAKGKSLARGDEVPSAYAHAHALGRQPSPPPASTMTDRLLPANPTSLDPAHLLLNLQIQVFIEIIRSASTSTLSLGGSAASLPPGSSPQQMVSSGYLPSSLAAANAPGIAAAASNISRAVSPAPSSSSSTGSGTSATGGDAAINPALHSALAVAQGLYTSAQRLPSYWRAMYLKELEQVTALLAYPDVEHSPVRKFLHRSRKVALAEQINSAILYWTGKPSQPLIESAVRQTAFVYGALHGDKVAVPSGHAVFSMAGCPAGPYEETLSKKNGGGKILPPWNFRNFLAER